MISYTWELAPITVKVSDNGHPNVIYAVDWRLTGQDAHYSSDFYGRVSLPEPSGIFTPYNDLTEAQVQEWVESALGAEQVAAYKAAIAQQIEMQKNPIDAVLPLPWQ